MNLPKIQALVAPLSAPVPSALGVAVQAYMYFASQSIILGWTAAVGAFIGIEAIGGASCYAVVKLHRQRSYGIEFFVSLAGIIVYIFSGYLVLHTTAILIFFFLAPFSYFAYAILRNMEAEIQEKQTETEAQIRLVNAQKNLINAEVRRTKAEKGEGVRAGRTPGQERPNNETTRVRVFEYLSDNPGASVRGVAAALGLPKSTVEPYVREWKDERES